MLITFETKAYANITMFGDVAVQLIKSMGHSGKVPGAIKADDVPKALAQLHDSLRRLRAEEQSDQDSGAPEDKEDFVSIDKRAKPLIELLEAAIERNTDVLWDE